jgi:hypothetical protein
VAALPAVPVAFVELHDPRPQTAVVLLIQTRHDRAWRYARRATYTCDLIVARR